MSVDPASLSPAVTVAIAILGGALRVSPPFLFVSLGEALTEKSGRINLGLEGILVFGAMSAYAVAYLTGSPWLGVLAAGVAGIGFGLLHGLGFAGALAEVGLPTAEIPLALFSFNVGIELGQLAFVGAVLLVAAALRRIPVAWPQWAKAVPAYGIGTMAVFWFLQRALSLM